MKTKVCWMLLAFLGLALVGPAEVLAVNYNEAVNGNLSGNPGLPTSLGTLDVGANSVIMTYGAGDFDIFTFNIAPTRSLVSITLVDYGGASLSFTGLQSGTVWTAGLGGGVNPAPLLGWTHIGNAQEGTNILDDYTTGFGTLGFSPPLLGGNYTLEFQDTGGAVPTTILLNVVPEPSSAVLGLLGLVTLAALGWRRKR